MGIEMCCTCDEICGSSLPFSIWRCCNCGWSREVNPVLVSAQKNPTKHVNETLCVRVSCHLWSTRLPDYHLQGSMARLPNSWNFVQGYSSRNSRVLVELVYREKLQTKMRNRSMQKRWKASAWVFEIRTITGTSTAH
jgi:hypothetical protein